MLKKPNLSFVFYNVYGLHLVVCPLNLHMSKHFLNDKLTFFRVFLTSGVQGKGFCTCHLDTR